MKVSGVFMIIYMILLVSMAVIPGVNAQEELSQTPAGFSEEIIDDDLRGLNVTTPESDGIYPSSLMGDPGSRMVKMVSSDSPGSSVDMTGVEWQTLLGDRYGDILSDIQETSDKGYIAVGSASLNGSMGGEIWNGYSDAWVIKFRNDKTIEWQRLFGGNGFDQGLSIRQTKEGDYVFAGYSSSNNSGFTDQNHGMNDLWVMKLDSNGNKIWQQLIGGSSNDVAHSIRQTSDGGYIIAGDTFSRDIPGVDPIIGGIYAAKLKPDGTIDWQKVFGGSGEDSGSSIIPATDGGYILTGFSNSGDFGGGQNHGNSDIFVMKLDDSGNQQWLKLIGGSGNEVTVLDNTINSTKDGGYILTGHTSSYDNGDVGVNHGSNDVWVVKLNSTGGIEWQNLYGGRGCDIVGGISEVSDGGYIFTGHPSSSESGDVTEKNFGIRDVWVVRLDSSGNILWEKLMGGNNWDQSTSIRQTSDGGYIFAGLTSSSNSGYIGTNHGHDDGWIVKLNPRLTVDVWDADTNFWVPNVTVTLHNINRNESRNLTALIKGRVVYTDSGENHWIVKDGKYSVMATADYYRTSAPVNFNYSGDGQRIIVNMTPLIANYTKSFSITCIEHYDNICGADGKCAISGSFDECDNIASNLIKAGYKMNFYHQDEEVVKENFAVDPSYTGHMLTESAFHYHSGHGTDPFNNSGTLFSTYLPLKNYAFYNITKGIGLVLPYDVKGKWGGKNKWVLLDSCKVLRDDDWGNALTTSHGILGYTSVSWVHANFGETFFKYAFDKNETIVNAYKNATIGAYQDENITAKAITKTLDQMENDQFPGVGYMAEDGDINSKSKFNLTWNCRSDLKW